MHQAVKEFPDADVALLAVTDDSAVEFLIHLYRVCNARRRLLGLVGQDFLREFFEWVVGHITCGCDYVITAHPYCKKVIGVNGRTFNHGGHGALVWANEQQADLRR